MALVGRENVRVLLRNVEMVWTWCSVIRGGLKRDYETKGIFLEFKFYLLDCN